MLALALVALAACCALAAQAPAAPVPGVSYTQYLPALPSPSQAHPNRVAHCKVAKFKCVRVEIQRMKALQERLGCDHRAVFDTTYLELTRTARDALKADPDLLRFKRFFYREDALFANVYFRTIKANERGEPVPAAWQIAFDAAASDDVTGVQDMLLGINAHVQNDMPFVLAQLGLRDREGNSRKVDHDKFNAVLSEGYERVVSAVRERYDPVIGVSNPDFLPADDVAGLELVRAWRETVWRNAERLVNAKTEEERAEVAASIQDYAGAWAQQIATPAMQGYGPTRDAYCKQQLGL
jgi:Family of unknown function (DUF5995)